MPFGHGPRNCIGMRFALLEAKMALIGILSKFDVSLCSKSPKVITMEPTGTLSSPKEGLWVKALKRN